MQLDALFERLKFEYLPDQIEAVCEQAAKEKLDYPDFLAKALEAEYAGRNRKGIESRMNQARFPAVKTLEQFDFDFQPSIDRQVVRNLAGLAFVERAENVIFLGPPGVGKTHLAVALGIKAVEAGYRVQFQTLDQLIRTHAGQALRLSGQPLPRPTLVRDPRRARGGARRDSAGRRSQRASPLRWLSVPDLSRWPAARDRAPEPPAPRPRGRCQLARLTPTASGSPAGPARNGRRPRSPEIREMV
ncbi:hypothetical protein CKO15_12655 [Halorhodospira abdelmalekii]|nr:hypothetical protein [Halorhodospira abdelmalekii]